MIPKSSAGVSNLSAQIGRDLVARAAEAYLAADLKFVAGLIALVAQDYDRAADVLVRDIEESTSLLRRAPVLADEIAAAITGDTRSFHVSDLQDRADALMQALIEVHAAIERAAESGDPAARSFEAEIWNVLQRWVERRAYDV